MKQGVLPRLIATLVNRRREVKKLMKAPDTPPSKIAQVHMAFAVLLFGSTNVLTLNTFTIVRYQTNGSEVDCKLDVWMSWFRRV
jgi:hypothetical protein